MPKDENNSPLSLFLIAMCDHTTKISHAFDSLKPTLKVSGDPSFLTVFYIMLPGGGCNGWNSSNHLGPQGSEAQPRDDGSMYQRKTELLKELGELLYHLSSADIWI